MTPPPPGTNVIYRFPHGAHRATVVATGPRLLIIVFRKPPGRMPPGTVSIVQLDIEAERLSPDPDPSPNLAAAKFL